MRLLSQTETRPAVTTPVLAKDTPANNNVLAETPSLLNEVLTVGPAALTQAAGKNISNKTASAHKPKAKKTKAAASKSKPVASQAKDELPSSLSPLEKDQANPSEWPERSVLPGDNGNLKIVASLTTISADSISPELVVIGCTSPEAEPEQ